MRAQQIDYTAYYRKEYANLVGQMIVDVRAMTPEEQDDFDWGHTEPGAIFTMTNGRWFIPMQDEEGNGPGALLFEGRE
jgi:hypothetical protein